MEIAIPSKGRPGKVKSLTILPGATLYVPALEESAYRECGAQSVVPVPNHVTGITRTRNWILDNCADPWLVMLDDDVKAAGYVELGVSHACHRTIRDWPTEFRRLFELTEDLGFRIWGIATQSAPRAVYPYKPFLWCSYVTASCMGIRNDTGIRFDESFPVKEDYELTLRCIVEDGGVMAARYIYWENSHWTGIGGCCDYRTQEMERKAIRDLQAKYPGMVRQITRGGSDMSIELTV